MFTETTNGTNIEGNELNINCITSKTNKFHLDSEGNLTVNSITTRQETENNISFDLIYPVGSIYMNTTLVDPSSLFGGTWERLAKGRTLVGVDENDADFNSTKKIGGSKFLQKHNHDLNVAANPGTGALGSGYGLMLANPRYPLRLNNPTSGEFTGWGTQIYGTGNSGNLQPYLTCYIWQRIA